MIQENSIMHLIRLEFLEAMNYGVSLISAGYEMPQPEGSDGIGS